MAQQWIPAVVLAIMLAACSGSKKIMPAEALHMDAATTQAYPSRFYDDKTHIRYDFRNDDKNLYVILETDNAAAKMRILREGVKVYFSPSGSKDATRYVQYPYNNPDRSDSHRDRGSLPGHPGDTTTGGRRPFYQQQPDDERNYTSFYKQAALTDNGKAQLLDVNSTAPGSLHFSATSDASGFFRYVVTIPRSLLAVNKNNTVIGISIAELKRPGGESAVHGTAHTRVSAGGGGMRGGGMGGGMHGMRGGGMHGGGMRGGGAGNGEGNYSHEDAGGKIDWWYKVALVS
ncbi:hypothetical protein A8C56_08070 [Niabella ginsenosidivorans]|uniref:Uncharacterized protein n=1 Tax=Niabella ginsenosidivorans TaxID=1176587 RepID=A0A1A9I0U1_9BACT|nr:hypothetical protein [Niabella ginsenosidivorans]ANH80945.1 hypothetical protein A8C56_08070 [Niabella ginsenosidivorans]